MRLERALTLAVTVGMMALVVAGSHAPLPSHSGGALLRLAWSASPERFEDCRPQSAEQLARLPSHMRQAVVCQGVTARYRLTAAYDGRVVVDRAVSAGGLRQDRRLYVLEEVPIPPGEALLEVRFERIDSPAASAASSTMPAAGAGRRDSVPGRLALVERRLVEPETVVLVSYDPDRRALFARQPPP